MLKLSDKSERLGMACNGGTNTVDAEPDTDLEALIELGMD